jgi:hypothetical protein
MLGQAGERLADVYVGVDVFARGNVVGGQFDTDKVGSGLYARRPVACMPFAVSFPFIDLPFSSVPQGKES